MEFFFIYNRNRFYRPVSPQISQNILEQIKDNFEAFRQGLKSLKENKDAPKAMAYLQFMGTELGYMKTSELTGILENMMTYTNIFFSDILSQVCTIWLLKILHQFTDWYTIQAFLISCILKWPYTSPIPAVSAETPICNR